MYKNNIYVLNIDSNIEQTLKSFQSNLQDDEEIVQTSVSETKLVITTKRKVNNLLKEQIGNNTSMTFRQKGFIKIMLDAFIIEKLKKQIESEKEDKRPFLQIEPPPPSEINKEKKDEEKKSSIIIIDL